MLTARLRVTARRQFEWRGVYRFAEVPPANAGQLRGKWVDFVDRAAFDTSSNGMVRVAERVKNTWSSWRVLRPHARIALSCGNTTDESSGR